ncbi:MAG: hypothetical protein QOG11_1254, partial [Solirubrobacteraceae bacterium]|nr:hypothetical protein [Solirubrobacteraceae bacterium]
MPWLLRLLLCACLAAALGPAGASAHGGGLESAPHRVATRTIDGTQATLAFHSDDAAAIPDALVVGAVERSRLRSLSAPTVGAPANQLPETWCGTQRSTDDTAHAVTPATGHVVKVIYAYASDQPDRFLQVADRLQASVSLLSRFLAAQSGNRRTLRFDLGTDCGAQYADLQVIALPKPKASYVVGGAPQFSVLAADVRAALGSAQPGPRDWAVYADGLRGSNGVAGTGEFWSGAGAESPTSTSHDAGGLMAAIWGPGTVPATYADPTTMLHEIGHNLGAVQGSAPHSTGTVGSQVAGHCTDEWDVMCYADGGPQNVMTTPCPKTSGTIVEAFDCGGDDYFSPTPAAGSWLADHWNVYNSAMLGSCASELAGTCGVADPASAPAEPVNTTAAPDAGWQRTAYSVLVTGTLGAAPAPAVQWRVDGGPTRLTMTASVPSEGAHVLETRVGDGAATWSGWRADAVRIDATPPAVALSCPGWQPGPAGCHVQGTDAVSGAASLEVRLGSSPATTVLPGPAADVSVGTEGETAVLARAADAAGGTSAWAQATARVDLTAPAIALRCAPLGGDAYRCAVDAGDGTGSGVASLAWRRDGGPRRPVAAGEGFEVTAPAGLSATATDAVGRTAPAALTLAVGIAPATVPATS